MITVKIFNHALPTKAMSRGEVFDEDTEIQDRYHWTFVIYPKRIIFSCNEGTCGVHISDASREIVEGAIIKFFQPCEEISFSWNHF